MFIVPKGHQKKLKIPFIIFFTTLCSIFTIVSIISFIATRNLLVTGIFLFGTCVFWICWYIAYKVQISKL